MSTAPVDVICYGKRTHWESRAKAIEFFFEGILECDGSERCRYMNIYTDLISGKSVCTDGSSERR